MCRRVAQSLEKDCSRKRLLLFGAMCVASVESVSSCVCVCVCQKDKVQVGDVSYATEVQLTAEGESMRRSLGFMSAMDGKTVLPFLLALLI